MVDPFGMRALYDPFSVLWLFSPHLTISLVTHFLILFYWNRAMKSFGAVSLDWAQKYVYVLIGVIVVVEIVSSIMRGIETLFEVLVFAQIFYGLLEILVIIFILYSAYGLYQFLRTAAVPSSTATSQWRTRRKVLRMTKLLLASAFLLVIAIITIVIGFLSEFEYAFTEMIPWAVECTCLTSIGILETLILKPVSHGKRASAATTEESFKSHSTTLRGSSSKRSTSSKMAHDSQSFDEVDDSGEEGKKGLKEEKGAKKTPTSSSSITSSIDSSSKSISTHHSENRQDSKNSGTSTSSSGS